MIDRAQLIQVFLDTQKYYKDNVYLAAAVANARTRTKFYEAGEFPELVNPYVHQGELRLSKSRTFQAAMDLHKEFPDKKIAVLNFASATNPGGGVKHGSAAQEESLCRCSTLFPAIDRRWLFEKYYNVNRNGGSVIYSDAIIYSPDIVICKTDEDIPQRLDREDFVSVDVITCAAPNLYHLPESYTNPQTGKKVRMKPEDLYEIHLQRARHILHIAAVNQVDILVLGAFGCGAFCNDPDTVAPAMREAVEDYRGLFDVIEFAIYCRDYETDNYKAFAQHIPEWEILFRDKNATVQ